MIELYPDRPAAGLASLRPAFQQWHVTLIVHYHVVRLASVASVDHDIPGNHQASAALGPATVQAFQFRGYMVIDGAECFAHGRFAETVGQGDSAGQCQGLAENISVVHSVSSDGDEQWRQGMSQRYSLMRIKL